MKKFGLTVLGLGCALLVPSVASATKGAELFTEEPYTYGRFETRMRVAAGDGVVSAFFLWKTGSDEPGSYWNELDYEKIGADCRLSLNALYGNPPANHTTDPTVNADLCGEFHVYGYEWTADTIVWLLDGEEIRRETGEVAAAYAQNASAGMQIHFNLWPGDESFGGNFNPAILPVHQYIDWVQYSAYENGEFTLVWREDFGGSSAPSGWLTGDWPSPKGLSEHDPLNVNFLGGCAILSMTSDDATGSAGAMPDTVGCTPGMGGMGGAGGGSNGGAGGTAGMGGADMGGAGMGGAGGTAGMGGADMGGADMGGAGMGGTAAGASGAGGVSTGGTGATMGGTAGTAAGGMPPAGGATAVGGSAAGGSPVTVGMGGTTGQPMTGVNSDDAAGCACRMPGSPGSPTRALGLGAALILGLAGAFRRRGPHRRG